MPNLDMDQILKTYRQNGYYFPIEVMSQQQAANYRAQLEAVEDDICIVSGMMLAIPGNYKNHARFCVPGNRRRPSVARLDKGDTWNHQNPHVTL